ncbi:cdc42 effector protein 5 [Hippocampus zosterae]|uniref:cdc42 effector protein 5 n=1 Tax=Hippocampus zosterae TaxID=109293 RepID=UPI00223DDAA9|nr:cdc42 effector protein 5 [Hippocampus zosterae]
MPLHKSTRASRLDPTMISAPLGDFRHTMHIGRGGDAFGDTSFLSTLGPSTPGAEPGSPGSSSADYPASVNHNDVFQEPTGSLRSDELDYSESVSSFALDLDLDLGPSMLGDVLGVMDGMGLDSDKDVFGPKSTASPVEIMEVSVVNRHNGLNGKNLDENQMGQGRTSDGIKPKGLRPKVRFSDKREEIIRQPSEEEEAQGFDFQEEDPTENPTRGVEAEPATLKDLPPSPASSHSSDYEGVSSLDRRRLGSSHSETDSEEGEGGRGYTFEDEFDDEIGL